MLHIPRGSFIDENKVQIQTIKLGLTKLLLVHKCPLDINSLYVALLRQNSNTE